MKGLLSKEVTTFAVFLVLMLLVLLLFLVFLDVFRA